MHTGNFTTRSDSAIPAPVAGVSVLAKMTAAALLLLTFIADMWTPGGVAAGVPYVLAVLLVARSRRLVVSVAVACSALVLLGWWSSTPDTALAVAAGHRLLQIGVIGLTATLTIKHMRFLDAMRKVRIAEHYLGRVIEAAPAGMLMIDRDGDIVLVNSRLLEIFGYGRSEMIAQPVEMLVPSRLQEEHPEFRAAFFSEPTIRRMGGHRQLFGLRKDGTEVPIDVGLNPLQTPDGLFVLATVVDVTLQKQREALIEEAAAAIDQKNREMEDFISIVVHDLKRPILALSGLLGLLRESALESLDDEAREDLDLAAGECRRMHGMVEDLNEIARAERAPLDVEDVRVAEVVEECLRPFAEDLRAQGIRVRAELDGIEVKTSRRHLAESLANVIENAVRHGCPSPGAEIGIDAWRTDDGVAVAVEDNGGGIRPDLQEDVFKLFRRLETNPDVPGSGVGLFAVRRLLDRLGGSIQLESAPNEGARFVMTIPDRSVPDVAKGQECT